MDDSQPDTSREAPIDTPTSDIFTPPSIHPDALLSGKTYSHYSPVPASLLPTSSSPAPECILGVDEAGRGPVLGPMVYSVFYLPAHQSDPLLRETHHFDDSKVLTPAVRTALMCTLCTSSSDLHASCGWATTSLSARAISSDTMSPAAARNLNTQAMDATVGLIKGVLARGVNVTQVYVDTVGPPASYQAKLQRFLPGLNITVAKKADSLYPCVSAASVCAKVTRDASLEALYAHHLSLQSSSPSPEIEGEMAWGSGYPSDGRCISWLRGNMHPLFGWGPECRFSWGTAKDMLDSRGVKVEWPVEDDGETARVTDFFTNRDGEGSEIGTWFGSPAGLEAF